MTTDGNAIEIEELRDLLVKRATESLSEQESARLAELAGRHPGQTDDSFDRTAAAIFLAAAPPRESLPAALRNRLVHLARTEITERRDSNAGD